MNLIHVQNLLMSRPNPKVLNQCMVMLLHGTAKNGTTACFSLFLALDSGSGRELPAICRGTAYDMVFFPKNSSTRDGRFQAVQQLYS